MNKDDIMWAIKTFYTDGSVVFHLVRDHGDCPLQELDDYWDDIAQVDLVKSSVQHTALAVIEAGYVMSAEETLD